MLFRSISKIFLGIYYNLSIWYKLTNKNTMGAFITMLGAGITILINYLFIPSMGYLACAIANLACYGLMMLFSIILGNKYYPIPYQWFRSIGYLVFACTLYLIHHYLRSNGMDLAMLHLTGVAFIALFIISMMKFEKEEMKKIPYLNKLYSK